MKPRCLRHENVNYRLRTSQFENVAHQYQFEARDVTSREVAQAEARQRSAEMSAMNQAHVRISNTVHKLDEANQRLAATQQQGPRRTRPCHIIFSFAAGPACGRPHSSIGPLRQNRSRRGDISHIKFQHQRSPFCGDNRQPR